MLGCGGSLVRPGDSGPGFVSCISYIHDLPGQCTSWGKKKKKYDEKRALTPIF